MRSRFQLLLGLILICAFTFIKAQNASYFSRLQPEIVRLGAYPLPPSTDKALVYPMDFARANILQASPSQNQKICLVDLVFTLYPQDPNTWKVGYDNLMEARFRQLDQKIPALVADTSVVWRIVIQTNCTSLAQATNMFHGFVLYPENSLPTSTELFSDGVANLIEKEIAAFTLPPFVPEKVVTERPAERFDAWKLEKNFLDVQGIIAGEKSASDSTIIEVFERHPEWKNALVVIDWTASMYRQGALLIAWQQEHRKENRIRHFVFFNDGDGKYEDEKVIGSTGGIYETPAADLSEMLPAIEGVTKGGEGGDHAENDLEALRQGIASCPKCKQIILIADNTGPVRDLILLREIEVPIKILLCRAYNDDIEPDYLTIADFTNGSLHTKDRDLENINDSIQNGILKVGEVAYEKKNDRFRKFKARN